MAAAVFNHARRVSFRVFIEGLSPLSEFLAETRPAARQCNTRDADVSASHGGSEIPATIRGVAPEFDPVQFDGLILCWQLDTQNAQLLAVRDPQGEVLPFTRFEREGH